MMDRVLSTSSASSSSSSGSSTGPQTPERSAIPYPHHHHTANPQLALKHTHLKPSQHPHSSGYLPLYRPHELPPSPTGSGEGVGPSAVPAWLSGSGSQPRAGAQTGAGPGSSSARLSVQSVPQDYRSSIASFASELSLALPEPRPGRDGPDTVRWSSAGLQLQLDFAPDASEHFQAFDPDRLPIAPSNPRPDSVYSTASSIYIDRPFEYRHSYQPTTPTSDASPPTPAATAGTGAGFLPQGSSSSTLPARKARPSRREEEQRRGRPRDLHLLWRSELDGDLRGLLGEHYSARMAGERLEWPGERAGDEHRSISSWRAWSRKVEMAGL